VRDDANVGIGTILSSIGRRVYTELACSHLLLVVELVVAFTRVRCWVDGEQRRHHNRIHCYPHLASALPWLKSRAIWLMGSRADTDTEVVMPRTKALLGHLLTSDLPSLFCWVAHFRQLLSFTRRTRSSCLHHVSRHANGRYQYDQRFKYNQGGRSCRSYRLSYRLATVHPPVIAIAIPTACEPPTCGVIALDNSGLKEGLGMSFQIC
jgi:hypothetical protein